LVFLPPFFDEEDGVKSVLEFVCGCDHVEARFEGVLVWEILVAHPFGVGVAVVELAMITMKHSSFGLFT